jgi:2-dehydro-3-deoxyglucarate aldolase/4-hydroxy-2-oxoheptanedioate aldolase
MTTLKSKLVGQGHAFGPMLMEFFSPGMPAIIAATGADFALFDMEHTGASLETMKAMLAGCRGLDLAPLVRVPRGEYHFIARALDIGAHGIMVPMVGSAAEAAAIASAAHYPPAGRRGAGFGIAHDDYRMAPPPETMARAAARTLTIAQIETVEGLDGVEAIAATPGIDVVWLGHFDLSNFMGIPGQFRHPDFIAAARRIADAARASGKIAGILAMDHAWAEEYWGYGYRMLAYGLDHMLFQAALSAGLRGLRKLASEAQGADRPTQTPT